MFDIFTEKNFCGKNKQENIVFFVKMHSLKDGRSGQLRKFTQKFQGVLTFFSAKTVLAGKFLLHFHDFFKKKNNYLQDAVPITAHCFPQVVPIYQIIAKIRIVAWKVPFDASPYLKRDIKSIWTFWEQLFSSKHLL